MDAWREWARLSEGCYVLVFEALSEITLVDVVLPTRSGTGIRKRCISQPTEHQKILLQRLGLNFPMALERAAM